MVGIFLRKEILLTIKNQVKRILNVVGLHREKAPQKSQSPTSLISVPFDNSYAWLLAAFDRVMQDPECATRPQYVYGILQGTALAKVLGINRISVIEFGVGGGAGLVAMECIAEYGEKMVDIAVDVYGFDTATGFPKPKDYRDIPYKWSEGFYPCDKNELLKRLRRSHLKIGLLSETLPVFVQNGVSPIAFVGTDICLYSSTKEALKLFDANPNLLLPRLPCSFRGAVGKDFSDYTGELLAVSEFNAEHSMRKISPIRGMEYFLPPRYRSFWIPMLHSLHIFDHPLYDHPESRQQSAIVDINDREHFVDVDCGLSAKGANVQIKTHSQQ